MLRGIIAMLLCALPAFSVTFNKDIAPVVYAHCTPCHHAGGIGPFPLTTYAEVAGHAAQIAAVTASRYMPPWPPAQGVGTFVGDRSLSPDQIHVFSEWLKDGKPEGPIADRPIAPHYDTEWQLGPPDLILKMSKPFLMPAEGSDVFRNFVLRSNVSKTRYVRGFELRVNNPRIVHHANVVLDRTASLRKRDGEDGSPGFPGMDVITEAAADNFDPDSHFLFFKPGSVLRPEPDNMAWRLDPGTDLILNLHLQPTGRPEKVEAEIGLYFTDQAPTRLPMLVQLENDGALHIAPGDNKFTVSDRLTLPVDVELLAIYPHAHYLGKQFDAWAVLPNGKQLPLIRIMDWDINWQAVYEYRQPVFLPKGTRLEMRIRYDNTSGNPRNPNRPPRLVTAGNRSQDEMGHVWFQVLPKNDVNGRMEIQEAVMRRRLEKYPDDFLAHYNLAALLQTEGKLSEAADFYSTALKENPSSATAHNSLGTVFLEENDLVSATQQLRQAITCDPTYESAHYNLARVMAADGKWQEAASEYNSVLKLDPKDAGANAALGAIEYKARDFADALKHLRAAAEAKPDDADIQVNLGAVLAITGDLPAAQQAFEAALKIDPLQSAAQANLRFVKAKLARQTSSAAP